MKIISLLKEKLLGAIASIPIILFVIGFIIITSANLKSCIPVFSKKNNNLASQHRVVSESKTNKKHQLIIEELKNLYGVKIKGSQLIKTDFNNVAVNFVKDSKQLNAASLGNNQFLVWESVADLPLEMIDSILAHELAHDQLLHVKKKGELAGLVDFFTEIFSFFFGADSETEETLSSWSKNLTIPTYSRQQEHEADAYALELLKALGYSNPTEVMSQTLHHFNDQNVAGQGGFFDTHPETSKRIQNLESITITNYSAPKFDITIVLSKALAKFGNTNAQLRLAISYYTGHGVIQDQVEAHRWFEKAAENGNSYAQYATGALYYLFPKDQVNIEQNYKKAYQWLKKAATQNVTEAQYLLYRDFYSEGSTEAGIEKDSNLGLKYLIKSAEQGFFEAEFKLALHYFYGDGVEKNYKQFETWISNSIFHGAPDSNLNLFNKNANTAYGVSEEAISWLRTKAYENEPYAQFVLGKILPLFGRTSAGKYWLEKAFEGGIIDAAFPLAEFYEFGEGTEQNDEIAFEYYLKATDSDDSYYSSEASYYVGYCYLIGRGVDKSEVDAFHWITKALELSDNESNIAKSSLSYLYYHGVGVKKDLPAATKYLTESFKDYVHDNFSDLDLDICEDLSTDLNYYNKAYWLKELANDDFGEAQYLLGILLIKCPEVEENKKIGTEWLEKAGKNGNIKARALL